jgi:hypothetical protein
MNGAQTGRRSDSGSPEVVQDDAGGVGRPVAMGVRRQSGSKKTAWWRWVLGGVWWVALGTARGRRRWRGGDGCWAVCDGWRRAALGVEEDGVVMASGWRRVVGAVG